MLDSHYTRIEDSVYLIAYSVYFYVNAALEYAILHNNDIHFMKFAGVRQINLTIVRALLYFCQIFTNMQLDSTQLEIRVESSCQNSNFH